MHPFLWQKILYRALLSFFSQSAKKGTFLLTLGDLPCKSVVVEVVQRLFPTGTFQCVSETDFNFVVD